MFVSMILAETNVFFGAVQTVKCFQVFSFVLLGGASPGGKLWKCLPHVLTVTFNRQMWFENIIFTESTPRAVFSMLMSWKKKLLLSNHPILFRMCSLVLDVAQMQAEMLLQFSASQLSRKGHSGRMFLWVGRRASFLPPSVHPSCHFFFSLLLLSLFPPLSHPPTSPSLSLSSTLGSFPPSFLLSC